MKKTSMTCAAQLVAVLGMLASARHVDAQVEPTGARNVANQFNITLPPGWSIYDQSVVLGRTDGTGVVIFSAESITKPGETMADPELMLKADSGEIASFFVDRHPAEKNATCEKLSRRVIYDIGTQIIQDPVVGRVRRSFAGMAPSSTNIELGGCKGVRFVVEARPSDPQNHWIIDVRVVSDGKVLYLFSLRNRAQYYAQNLPAFESALATVRLTP